MASRKEKDHYYEYIVVGCGGIGSGTLYWLSKRAAKGKSGKTFQVKKKNNSEQIAIVFIRNTLHFGRANAHLFSENSKVLYFFY